MTSTQLAFMTLTFVAAAGVAYALLLLLFDRPADARRLQALGTGAAAVAPGDEGGGRLHRLLALFARLSAPSEHWESSPLRVRFLNAGLRGPRAPAVYFAAKTVLTFVVPGAFAFYLGLSGLDFRSGAIVRTLAIIALLAAVGYILPNVVLSRMVEHRKRELFEVFPDALDLMRVCVEAGLGLDAAIARVGDEFRLQSAALYEELHLVSLELRAGAARERALRNLALRVGLEDVDGLVAMLVQADRFGTSVSESLRVHSEDLRVKRRLLAEETAAKIPVKMLFPLIFCILPALLVVLIGPAAISLIHLFTRQLAGH